MTDRGPRTTPSRQWSIRLMGDGKYVCACSCGWLEPGWPNYRIANASVVKHLETCRLVARS